MSTSIGNRLMQGVAIALGLGLTLGSCSDQPKARCAAARGNFAATYQLVSGTGDCASLKGDVLSVQTYNGSNPDQTPNWDDASMAIQPMSITGILQAAGGAMVSDPNPNNKPYALGHFATAEPGSDDFCVAPVLSPARLQLPEIPAQMDGMGGTTAPLPATDVEYQWSQVRVYVTAAANGTMFTANLTLRQGTCTAQYAVNALYPAISCLVPPPPPPPPMMSTDEAGAPDGETADSDTNEGAVSTDDASAPNSDAADPGAVDAGGDGASDPDAGATPTPAPPVLDETLCSAQADPARGRPLGSGISPDVLTRCDPDLQLCVLAEPAPAQR